MSSHATDLSVYAKSSSSDTSLRECRNACFERMREWVGLAFPSQTARYGAPLCYSGEISAIKNKPLNRLPKFGRWRNEPSALSNVVKIHPIGAFWAFRANGWNSRSIRRRVFPVSRLHRYWQVCGIIRPECSSQECFNSLQQIISHAETYWSPISYLSVPLRSWSTSRVVTDGRSGCN